MARWKVRKSRRTGDWWVHSPGCYELGGFWCILFGGDCVNTKTFKKAFMYADTRAHMNAPS
jgi:hypothetical protein